MCVRCVMDLSDPGITFDGEGICNHCHSYAAAVRRYLTQASDDTAWEAFAARVRAEGVGRPYDCVIGVSGGVDSSYVAVLAKKAGLRPLAFHLDNGWNSEAAVRNIERLLRALDLDLVTHVVDWPEFRDLQLAFLRASVVDIELPTDHAITALGYALARQHKIRYVLNGNNVVTEAVMPAAWAHRKTDLRNLRAIHARHSPTPLRTLPTASTLRLQYYARVQGLRMVNVLNLVHYDKPAAMEELAATVGWEYYGGKHYESLFTRFYQAHILPRKFGIDKRRAHLSALVNSGQITREDALEQLAQPLYDPVLLANDTRYVAKKLGLSVDELTRLLDAPARSHDDYPSDERYVLPLLAANRVVQRVAGLGARGGAGARLALRRAVSYRS